MAQTEVEYVGKRVDVEIITDTYNIRGTVFVPSTGKAAYTYASRLSDLLNDGDKQFLALTNVKAVSLSDVNEKWEACCSKVNLSGSNGNVNMSGWKDDNPDDERRETTRHHTTIVT